MVVFFLILLIIFLFRETLFPSSGKIIYGGDLLTQFYYWKGYLAENIQNGTIPFWNPYNFSGTPFLAHPFTAFFYPGNFVFYFFPLNFAFSIFYVLHFFLAGLGIYFFLRYSSADKLSSLAGAFVMILSGFFASRIYAGHVDILSTSVWIPWVLWSTQKLLKYPTKKNFLFFTLFFSLEILAGYMALVVFTLELLFFYCLYLLLKTKISFFRYFFLFFGLILSIGITTIQWLPTWELVKLSIRGNGLPYELASWGSLPISGLSLFWNPFNEKELKNLPYGFGGYVLPNFFEYYTGKIILLVFLGFLFLRLFRFLRKAKDDFSTSQDIWFYFLVSLFFLWVSFGIYAFFNLHYLLYKLVPFYQNIRIPSQHLMIVSFLIPIVFGLILHSLKNKIFQFLIFFLVVVELYSYSSKFYLLSDLPEKKHNNELFVILEKEKEKGRLLPNFSVVSPVLNYFDFNSSLRYKIFTTSGYDPIILRDYYQFIERVNHSLVSLLPYYNVEVPPVDPYSSLLDFLNINFVLTEFSSSPLDENYYEIILQNKEFVLYRKKKVKDRFYFIPFKNDTVCYQDAPSKIKLLSYKAHEIIIYSENACEGLLFTSEIYYPGWKVIVDGYHAQILKKESLFRSVRLPIGRHIVRFYYSPEIYFLGGLISFFSVLWLISFIYFYKLKPRVRHKV